jgi:hypothetical protein
MFPDVMIPWYSQTTRTPDFGGFSDNLCSVPVTITVLYEVNGQRFQNLPPEVIWDHAAKSFSYGKCEGASQPHQVLDDLANAATCAGQPADGSDLKIIVIASAGTATNEQNFNVKVVSVCTATAVGHTITTS